MAGGTDFTNNLSLPYLISNQAQKHVTLNESLRALDGLVQASILSRTETDPPASPVEGDRYLVAASAIGDWTGQEGEFAMFADGEWLFHTPQTGWRVWVEDEAAFLVFDGTNWRETTSDELQNLALFGLGATADTNNPLLAKLNALLFTALETANSGTGDLRAKLNKEASGNVLSLLFQTNYSTRAEIGLVGDDDLLLKVSPDGSTFYEGIRVDKDTGEVSFPNGVSGYREQLVSSRTYYVDGASGSDSNDGLSSGSGAFATIQKAIDTALTVDMGQHDITISVADGTYSEDVIAAGSPVGNGTITLSGNLTNPENVLISASDHALQITERARLSIEGLKIETSSGCAIYANTGGLLTIKGDLIIGEGPQAQLRVSDNASQIKVSGDIELEVAGGIGIYAQRGAVFDMQNKTITLTGTPAYSYFLVSSETAVVLISGNTFTGSATGTRYSVRELSLCKTSNGGASYLPGDAAGAVSNGGLYI